MKKQLFILLAAPLLFISTSEAPDFQKEFHGSWVKVAGGEDTNKNRILDESEKIKNPEPSLYDNFYFTNNGKFSLDGMRLRMVGTYTVKTSNGKRILYCYPEDTPADMSQEDKDIYASKFEVVSVDAKKMVLIPPMYTSMLIVYDKL